MICVNYPENIDSRRSVPNGIIWYECYADRQYSAIVSNVMFSREMKSVMQTDRYVKLLTTPYSSTGIWDMAFSRPDSLQSLKLSEGSDALYS